MDFMKFYSVEGTFTQPYKTHGTLWEAIQTNAICDEMEFLETQLRTTSLASKMLDDIGVKTK
tara:strand:+ start:4101 stop:4286 length:186 start_codon:yes stop_codon:yes gene_type:complete